ncbi:VIT family protein [uncultured archaeon]|nr:VIT family protein [uncultured archaeon]
MERNLLKGEILDNAVYSALADGESDPSLKRMLKGLAAEEAGHIRIWRSVLGKDGDDIGPSVATGLRAKIMVFARRVMGVGFVTRALEVNEISGIASYKRMLKAGGLTVKGSAYVKGIIAEEEGHERALTAEVEKYKSRLGYLESTILGLNDGLVEILAVIAGLATVATSSMIIVIIGLIAGISGTLSMAGGVYLSAKSQNLVEGAGNAKADANEAPSPRTAALHCGAYYFLGALIAVLPFLLGLKGVEGTVSSVVLVSVALVAASALVGIISGTSIRRRSLEMLAISLGAAFVTIIFGTFARAYFGVSI